MEAPLALLVGILFGASVYALLSGTLLRLVIGIILLTAAANILIFTVGGLVRAEAPLIPPDAMLPREPFAPPLPQALVLTAIVIGFGLVVFTLILIYRTYLATGEADADRMRAAVPAADSSEEQHASDDGEVTT